MKVIKSKKYEDADSVRLVKVYRIRIEPSVSQFWYHAHEGDEFYAMLISKQVSDTSMRPVFALVEQVGDVWRPPSIIRTVRPEDCSVMEEYYCNNNINMFYKSFE